MKDFFIDQCSAVQFGQTTKPGNTTGHGYVEGLCDLGFRFGKRKLGRGKEFGSKRKVDSASLVSSLLQN
jgi:hypothetical protein